MKLTMTNAIEGGVDTPTQHALTKRVITGARALTEARAPWSGDHSGKHNPVWIGDLSTPGMATFNYQVEDPVIPRGLVVPGVSLYTVPHRDSQDWGIGVYSDPTRTGRDTPTVYLRLFTSSAVDAPPKFSRTGDEETIAAMRARLLTGADSLLSDHPSSDDKTPAELWKKIAEVKASGGAAIAKRVIPLLATVDFFDAVIDLPPEGPADEHVLQLVENLQEMMLSSLAEPPHPNP